jgi:hypothetical protein
MQRADMPMITYRTVDRALVEALPELAAPYARFLADYPDHAENLLQYLLFQWVFLCFIENLLAMPANAMRETLLQRSFAFLEEMLRADDSNVSDLGAIAILEGRPAWWLARSMPFLGPAAIEYLDAARPRWREEATEGDLHQPKQELNDLYGVGKIIAAARAESGV